MSHISSIKTQIADLDALADACHELGLELRRNQHTYKTYNGRETACDAAIVDPANARAYEVGLVRAADGQTYTLGFDAWNAGHGMMAKIGSGCGKLLQEYGRAKTRRIAASKGWSYREERLQDGRIRCYCEPKAQAAWAGGSQRGW
jgi:hypothetical protein